MVTPTARYAFSATGEVKNTRGDYPRAMAETAAERGVPLIDLTGMTMSLWSRIGPTRLRQYFCWVDAGEHPLHPDGNIDSSHLNHPGAYEVARLVVTALVEQSVLGRADVDVAALMEPEGLPAVSQEFTVQSPESALNYGSRTGGAPTLARPAAGATVGPMTKFSGTAAPGTDYLLFFEQGRYIGGTGVGAAGQWLWRRAVEWTPGEHVVQCVALRADGCSPPVEQHFQVLAGVEPPVITAPKEGRFSGPKVRFAGRTRPGATKVVLMEAGRLIGATAVDEKGSGTTPTPTAGGPDTTPSRPSRCSAPRNRPPPPSGSRSSASRRTAASARPAAPVRSAVRCATTAPSAALGDTVTRNGPYGMIPYGPFVVQLGATPERSPHPARGTACRSPAARRPHGPGTA